MVLARTFVGFLLLSACSEGPTPCEPPGDQVPRHRSAGCLVVQNEGLLLVKNAAGWTIPGGYAEGSETSEQTAARETMEEASVSVTVGPRFCAVPAKGFVMHVCAPAGSAAPTPDKVETSEARFFSAAEVEAMAPADLRFPDQKPALLLALKAAASTSAP